MWASLQAVWTSLQAVWVGLQAVSADLQAVWVDLQAVRVDLQAVRVGLQAVRADLQAVRVDLQAVRVDLQSKVWELPGYLGRGIINRFYLVRKSSLWPVSCRNVNSMRREKPSPVVHTALSGRLTDLLLSNRVKWTPDWRDIDFLAELTATDCTA